jgi:activator of HSP90 ATPase
MSMRVTRRELSLALGGMGVIAVGAEADKPGATIHQEHDYKAPPARIYEVLLDAKQFAAMSGDTAEIEAKPGGAFRLFGGRIEGRTIELAPNQRIVQAWRPAYWAAGVYSIIRFELVPRDAGTHLVFDQAGITADLWEHLSEGWRDHYFVRLHKYLDA